MKELENWEEKYALYLLGQRVAAENVAVLKPLVLSNVTTLVMLDKNNIPFRFDIASDPMHGAYVAFLVTLPGAENVEVRRYQREQAAEMLEVLSGESVLPEITTPLAVFDLLDTAISSPQKGMKDVWPVRTEKGQKPDTPSQTKFGVVDRKDPRFIKYIQEKRIRAKLQKKKAAEQALHERQLHELVETVKAAAKDVFSVRGLFPKKNIRATIRKYRGVTLFLLQILAAHKNIPISNTKLGRNFGGHTARTIATLVGDARRLIDSHDEDANEAFSALLDKMGGISIFFKMTSETAVKSRKTSKVLVKIVAVRPSVWRGVKVQNGGQRKTSTSVAKDSLETRIQDIDCAASLAVRQKLAQMGFSTAKSLALVLGKRGFNEKTIFEVLAGIKTEEDSRSCREALAHLSGVRWPQIKLG